MKTFYKDDSLDKANDRIAKFKINNKWKLALKDEHWAVRLEAYRYFQNWEDAKKDSSYVIRRIAYDR